MKIVAKKIEREPLVLTVPFDSETRNYFKYVDRSGRFPQTYYISRDTWDDAPKAILVTIEALE